MLTEEAYEITQWKEVHRTKIQLFGVIIKNAELSPLIVAAKLVAGVDSLLAQDPDKLTLRKQRSVMHHLIIRNTLKLDMSRTEHTFLSIQNAVM